MLETFVGPLLWARMLLLQAVVIEVNPEEIHGLAFVFVLFFFRPYYENQCHETVSLPELTVCLFIRQMVGVCQEARLSHQGLSQGILVPAENWRNPRVGSGQGLGHWPGP